MRLGMASARRRVVRRTSGTRRTFRALVLAVSAAAACGRGTEPRPPARWIDVSLPDSAPLPLVELRGDFPGPTVALVAGVHGGKRAAVAALRTLHDQLGTERLHGTVLLLPIAHVAGYLAGLAQQSPLDSLNLNRVFPGRPDGRPTERVAHAIMREVVGRSDYLVDLHGSDGDEAVGAFAYAARPVLDPRVDSAALGLARLWGTPRVVWDTAGPRALPTARFLQTAAHLSGVPALTVFEAGATSDDSAATAAFVRGARRLLTGLGVLEMGDGHPIATEPAIHPRREVAVAPSGGVWRPARTMEPGRTPAPRIRSGELLGTLVDSGGKPRELRAAASGVPLHVRRAGRVAQGTPLTILAADP